VADEGYLVSPQPQLLRAESGCLPGKAKSGKAARANKCKRERIPTTGVRTSLGMTSIICHCEERSDVAIRLTCSP